MKIVIVFCAFLALAYSAQIGLGGKIRCMQNVDIFQNRILENEIKAKIEKLRQQLKENGIPKLGIDSLDPLVIENKRIQLEKPAHLDANVSLNAEGLLGFEITKLKIQVIGLKVELGLKFPNIKVHADYGLDLKLNNGSLLNGNGDLDTDLKELVITAKGSLKNKFVNGKLRILIKKLDVSLAMGDFTFKITGVNNDEKLSEEISKKITESAPQVLEEIQNQITSNMPKIIELINNWLINNIVYEANLDPYRIC